VICTLDVFNAIEHKRAQFGDTFPDLVYEGAEVVEVDVMNHAELEGLTSLKGSRLLTVKDSCPLSPHIAFRLLAAKAPQGHLILLKDTFTPPVAGKDPEVLQVLLHASAQLGSLLADGIGDGIFVRGEPGPGASVKLAFNILQGVGNRIFKTEYVACPSCGRTLFDLQSTTAKIRAATGHLKGVKIAVMGCIVNGPGEMADADFGYVGGAPSKVNLYIGKTPVKFNIPETEAVDRLVDLIRENGKWVDPAPEPVKS
jgi:(E)-4-hydroxy-3-methylbut-2-enyl-diphosphate synthase